MVVDVELAQGQMCATVTRHASKMITAAVTSLKCHASQVLDVA